MAEEKNKTRKKRRAYLDDFYQDAAGKYVYRGKLYRYAADTLPRRQALIRMWLLAGGGLAALVVNGLVPNPALSGCFYVVIPYVVGLIAACSVCWALGRITAAGDPLRAYVYDETVAQLPTRCMIGAVGSGVAAAGQLVYLLLNSPSGAGGVMLLFLILECLAAVVLYKLKLFISVLEWRTDS